MNRSMTTSLNTGIHKSPVKMQIRPNIASNYDIGAWKLGQASDL